MRSSRAIFLFVCTLPGTLSAQIDYADLQLDHGDHPVGYRHLTLYDSSRTYVRTMDYRDPLPARPIPVSIWYPAKREGGDAGAEPMVVQDYLDVIREEAEWEGLPREFIVDWFYYPLTPHKDRQTGERVRARAGVLPGDGKFPLIVYAPSYQASSVENFALCEMLASHGYLVLSPPSRGYGQVSFRGGTVSDAAAQRRDLEFILGRSEELGNPDGETILLMGFSFGGLSLITLPMRNHRIDGVISLDGTIKYRPEVAAGSPFYAEDRFRVPFVHFSQRVTPTAILAEAGAGASLNYDFRFRDSLRSPVYELRMNRLTHGHFATMGVIFGNRDERQDAPDADILTGHRDLNRYVLATAHRMRDGWSDAKFPGALALSASDSLVYAAASRFRLPGDRELGREHLTLAGASGYRDLRRIQDSLRAVYPGYTPPEFHFNTLGLQLIFQPETFGEGERIFRYALDLYPGSSNLYDSLAEGYRVAGKREEAIAAFRRSLELNPDNENAARRLREMGAVASESDR